MRLLTGLMFAAIMSFGLSGCITDAPKPDLVTQVPVVISPPVSLLQCHVTPLPNAFLDNKSIGTLITRQHADNVKCKNNMDGVRKYIDAAKKEFPPQ